VSFVTLRTRRRRYALAAAGALVAGLFAVSAWHVAGGIDATTQLAGPSAAGLNYGFPHSVAGGWLGTEWLRTKSDRGSWAETQTALAADLGYIDRHGLGKVIRLFVGLDQAIVWDRTGNFDGFDAAALDHLDQAFTMLDAHGIRAVVVILDQEEVSSAGNFHFEALDGRHPNLRSGYLRAVAEFMKRFGARATVIGWDLFNEAYNSLGTDGGLPTPPQADPVSPGYSDATIHAWLRDLYTTAKHSAPMAMLTVSDSTELYWNPSPDLSKYRDVVDFYDIHVYDDRPKYPNWRWTLDKPYIVGEAGASTVGHHYDDQAINAAAVTYLLDHSRSAGVSFVLVQGAAFGSSRGVLTPTGEALASYLRRASTARTTGPNPVDVVAALVFAAARRLRHLLPAWNHSTSTPPESPIPGRRVLPVGTFAYLPSVT